MAARAKASNVAIFLDVIGKVWVATVCERRYDLLPFFLQSEATQVYKVGIPSDAHPPQTLVAMVTSFNHLNTAIQAVIVGGESLTVEVRTYHSLQWEVLPAFLTVLHIPGLCRF